MKVVIAGGRDFRHKPQDWDWLDEFHREHRITLVISGGATGADRLGELWAGQNNIPVERMTADWYKHGRAAGPIRNRRMAREGDAVILFPGGRGTASMRKEAEKRDLSIFTVYPDFEQ